MDNMTYCTIELKNAKDEYHPEDTIEGKVICVCIVPTYVKGIMVEFLGQESTKFPKLVSSGKFNVINPRKCLDPNTFLSLFCKLSPEGKLKDGRHRYRFSFKLPKNIPSTYTSHLGRIFFFLNAVIRMEELSNIQCTKEISVVAPICNRKFAWFDHIIPTHKPYRQSTKKTFSTLCSNRSLSAPDQGVTKYGVLSMEIYLPKRAFIQGEYVTVQVDISNESDEVVEKVELFLGQTIEVKENIKEEICKSERNVLVELKKDGVESHRNRAYTFDLMVPDIPTLPNFSRCSLLTQKFWVELVATVRDHPDVILTTWVLIGQIANDVEETSKDPGNMLSFPHKNSGKWDSHTSTSLPLTKRERRNSSLGCSMTSSTQNSSWPHLPDSSAPNNATVGGNPSLESPPSFKDVVLRKMRGLFKEVSSKTTYNDFRERPYPAASAEDVATPSTPDTSFVDDPSAPPAYHTLAPPINPIVYPPYPTMNPPTSSLFSSAHSTPSISSSFIEDSSAPPPYNTITSPTNPIVYAPYPAMNPSTSSLFSSTYYAPSVRSSFIEDSSAPPPYHTLVPSINSSSITDLKENNSASNMGASMFAPHSTVVTPTNSINSVPYPTMDSPTSSLFSPAHYSTTIPPISSSCSTAPYPTSSPPTMFGSAPYPTMVPPTNSSVGIAPYPMMFPSTSSASSALYPTTASCLMDNNKIVPYPPKADKKPPQPPDLYPPEMSTDSRSRWNLVRSNISTITHMPMPMPSYMMTNPTAYPLDDSLRVCRSIGFAVTENISADRK